MKTKQAEIDRLAKNYLLEAIDWSGYLGYTIDKEPEDTYHQLKFVDETFRSEYGHMIERVGYQKALAEWFAGLPSAINIDFENYRILELAKEWGSIPEDATEAQEDKILNNWFMWIANKLIKLLNSYDIKTN